MANALSKLLLCCTGGSRHDLGTYDRDNNDENHNRGDYRGQHRNETHATTPQRPSVAPSKHDHPPGRKPSSSSDPFETSAAGLAAPKHESVRPGSTSESDAAKSRRRSLAVASTAPATRTTTADSLPTLLTMGSTIHGHHVAESERPSEIFGPTPESSQQDRSSRRSSESTAGTIDLADGQHPVDLLGPMSPKLAGRKSLVLDLDETLVHSSFKYLPEADFMIPVDIEGVFHDVFVVKRPGVDEFLSVVCDLFEVIVFTASVAKYGDPLLDQLDPNGRVHYRLFREACSNYNGNYVKNLAQLGRPLQDIIIVDNSPASYVMQPQNAVPVSSWFSDMHDNELLDMVPFLTDLSKKEVTDVSLILDTLLEDDLDPEREKHQVNSFPQGVVTGPLSDRQPHI